VEGCREGGGCTQRGWMLQAHGVCCSRGVTAQSARSQTKECCQTQDGLWCAAGSCRRVGLPPTCAMWRAGSSSGATRTSPVTAPRSNLPYRPYQLYSWSSQIYLEVAESTNGRSTAYHTAAGTPAYLGCAGAMHDISGLGGWEGVQSVVICLRMRSVQCGAHPPA
jgi:hypothetical protein